MKIFSLDFFKREPFELNFRMLVLVGFWPLDTTNRRDQILHSIFSFFCFFSLSSTLAVQILNMYILWHDPAKVTNTLSFFAIGIIVGVKSYTLLSNIKYVTELKRELSEYKNSRTNVEDKKILEKSNNELTIIMKIFYIVSIPCAFIWMLYPYIDSSPGDRKVLFPYRLPWDDWSQTTYLTLYFYQCIALLGLMINVVSTDSMFCGFVLRIKAHYDIIIKNFKYLDRPITKNKVLLSGWEKMADYNERVDNVLKENTKLHNRVLYELYLLQSIYSAPCMMQFIGAVVSIGSVIIDSIVVTRTITLQLLQRLLYLIAIVWDTFLYCFSASILKEKSFELANAAFETKWYVVDPKIRKNFVIFIMRCQKPPKLRAGNIFPLELKTFVKLMKITYDMTALLYQTTRNHY